MTPKHLVNDDGDNDNDDDDDDDVKCQLVQCFMFTCSGCKGGGGGEIQVQSSKASKVQLA